MVGINLIPVGSYGEAEFIFGILKISLVVGLIVIGLVIDLGKAPNHERLGFRYWKEPFRELSHNGTTIHGAKGKLLGVWSTLVNAGFAFAHVQVVAIAGKETHNPRTSIPLALSRTAYRILFLYISVIFILGLIVPASHPGLHSDTGTATSSPFVIAAKEAGIVS
ncbi:hypothetical protein FRC03_002158 [Tulasnella sp. 419]|nr:hypothetical protein FRC03_002158 [Tulasnella sp. 419]